jgi:hypothetical protein
MRPIVLVHGYSTEGKDSSVEEIYGTLPADLRHLFGPDVIQEINLARWISLSDGTSLDDVSFALERALRSPAHVHLLETRFHTVIHSTGALVVRNWMRLFPRRPSPIENLVHLAGANFGSGLVHVAQGELARWTRVLQGVDRGLRVLNELELGAWKTLDLHLHFLQDHSRIYEDYRVQEFCAIGSQTLGFLRVVPIRYVKEDSADCTVRTSAGNLNFNYVTVEPKPEALDLSVSQVRERIQRRLDDQRIPMELYRFGLSRLASTRREIPFAVLYETAHIGSDLGIVKGAKTREQVLPLVQEALDTPYDENAYRQVAVNWAQVTRRTQARAGKLTRNPIDWNIHRQYEGHSQLIFRVRDQYGLDVEHCDITFKSNRQKQRTRLEKMIEDRH